MNAVQTRITLKNILFATDFEAPARRALPFAVALATRYAARLHAVHVIPLEAYSIASPEMVEPALREAQDFANYSLNQTIGPLRHHGLQCNLLLGEGDVPSVINMFVREHAADLLVVGTSSRAGVGKMLLGSVAEELIREAECPVLSVGPHVATFASEGIHNILCATDFSPASQRAVELAMSMADGYSAHLTFVHVMESMPHSSPYLAIQVMERRMRDAIPADPELLHEPQLMVETGTVGERILHLASDLTADLIVMGVRGAGASAHTASRFGSIAHKVISQATCPVLTVGQSQRMHRE